MPQLIRHIDAIARAKGCGVLRVRFPACELVPDTETAPRDWKTYPARQRIIEWLDANSIGWECCAGIEDRDSVLPGYDGQIHVDVPLDQADPVYREIAAFLGNTDGSIPGVWFEYVPLSMALRNRRE